MYHFMELDFKIYDFFIMITSPKMMKITFLLLVHVIIILFFFLAVCNCRRRLKHLARKVSEREGEELQ